MPESVAEHTFGTAMLTCFLGELVNQSDGDSGGQLAIDIGRAARMALVHDLAESLVTDLPKTATEYVGREVKHAAEGEAMRTLLADVGGGETYLALWQEYESGESREARLVRDADKLEMSLQALHYASTGNRNLDEFWHGHEWAYDVTREFYEGLTGEGQP